MSAEPPPPPQVSADGKFYRYGERWVPIQRHRGARSHRNLSWSLSSLAGPGIAALAMAVSPSIMSQAERAIASVIEAQCPLCKVELRVHNGRACCPCCGDSYRAGPHRLEMQKCAEHGRDCEHWDAVWAVWRLMVGP